MINFDFLTSASCFCKLLSNASNSWFVVELLIELFERLILSTYLMLAELLPFAPYFQQWIINHRVLLHYHYLLLVAWVCKLSNFSGLSLPSSWFHVVLRLKILQNCSTVRLHSAQLNRCCINIGCCWCSLFGFVLLPYCSPDLMPHLYHHFALLWEIFPHHLKNPFVC